MLLNEGTGKLKKLKSIMGIIGLPAALLLGFSSNSYGGGLLSIGKDTTICAGQCVTISSVLGGICHWSTGATGTSITVCPTSDQTIKLTLNAGLLVLSDSIHIKVDNHCVYPGDANGDGKVDKNDVLKIGIGYGKTGSARSVSGTEWSPVHASDWSNSFNSGENYKYADCNGDGKIDSKDVAIVAANYSHSHNKTEQTEVDGNPDLYYIPNKDTVSAGDTLVLQIMLGTSDNPVSDIYGVSFTHTYSGMIVQPGSMNLDVNPDNCWLYGSSGAVIPFLQPNYGTNSGDIAISRTDQTNVSGYGQIGTLSIVVQDNVGAKQTLPYHNLFPVDIKAINKDEADVPLSTKPAKVYWKSVTNGITPTLYTNAQVEVYPNPVTGRTLTIHFSNVKAEKLVITDLVGNEVLSTTGPLSGQMQIDLPAKLRTGFYFLKAATSQGMITKKLYITN